MLNSRRRKTSSYVLRDNNNAKDNMYNTNNNLVSMDVTKSMLFETHLKFKKQRFKRRVKMILFVFCFFTTIFVSLFWFGNN